MPKFLLVPIHVDAMFVGSATDSFGNPVPPEAQRAPEPGEEAPLPGDGSQSRWLLGEMTDYTRLPYQNQQGASINADKPYISDTVVSQPFARPALMARAGVHLHWALPDALTHGVETAEGIEIPRVPNRWLIMRSGGTNKNWVVESDYLHPETTTPNPSDSASPANILQQIDHDNEKYNAFRLMGRCYEHSATRTDPDSDPLYADHLTAMGPLARVQNLDHEKAMFAAFYPNCRSVFGFHDDDTPSQDDLADETLVYDVVGWYSHASQDCLAELMQKHEGKSHAEKLEALQAELSWTTGAGEIPSRTLYCARIICTGGFRDESLDVQDSPHEVQTVNFLDPPKVAVGTSGPQALATHLEAEIMSQITTTSDYRIAEYLEAIDLSERIDQDQVDVGAKFNEARHESSFSSYKAGMIWRILPDNSSAATAVDTSADPIQIRAQVPLPENIAFGLNSLNSTQFEYEDQLAGVGDQRERLYAEWYHFKSVERTPTLVLANKLSEALRTLGQLTLQTDARGNVSAATAQPTTAPSLDQIEAELEASLAVAEPEANTAKEDDAEGNVSAATAEPTMPSFLDQVEAEAEELSEGLPEGLPAVAGPEAPAENTSAALATKINSLIGTLERFNKQSRFRLETTPSSQPALSLQPTGEHELVEDALAGWCLEFAGADKSATVTPSRGIRAVSMWVELLPSETTSGSRFLTDVQVGGESTGRSVRVASGQGDREAVFSGWDKVVLNGGVVESARVAELPTQQWFHLYLEVGREVDQSIYLMSSQNGTNNLQGKIASVCFHAVPLPVEEIQARVEQKAHFVVPKYDLKRTQGPRYWEPNDPVVLVSGRGLGALLRHGHDGRSHEDGFLECDTYDENVDLSQLSSSTVQTLRTKINSLFPAAATGDKIGRTIWDGPSWHPLLMDWSVDVHSVALTNDVYDADGIETDHTLPVNSLELAPKSSFVGNLNSQPSVYKGTSILTPAAYSRLRANLEKLLVDRVVPKMASGGEDMTEAQLATYLETNLNVLAATAKEDFLRVLGQINTPWTSVREMLDHNPGYVFAPMWFKHEIDQRTAFGAELETQRIEASMQDQLNRTRLRYVALEGYKQVRNTYCLSQRISGFNDELRTYSRSMQIDLPPLASHPDSAEVYFRRLLQASAFAPSLLRAPDFSNDFLPIRNGLMNISELRLIDNFGRTIRLKKADAAVAEQPDIPIEAMPAEFREDMEKLAETVEDPFPEQTGDAAQYEEYERQLHETGQAGSPSSPADEPEPQPSTDESVTTAGESAEPELGDPRADYGGPLHAVRDLTKVRTTDSMTPPAGSGYHVYLAPRLAQEARVDFRWLSASQGAEQLNDHPALTPICGWILPNNLDRSLWVYDGNGRPLGIINARAAWRAMPGGSNAVPISSFTNTYLRQMVNFIIGQGEAFLSDFLVTANTALKSIEPENFAQHQSPALLIGRPLALVRARVNLEMLGPAAVNQHGSTQSFDRVRFPIRIGEYQQLNDGLVGYWVESNNGAYQDNMFYAPQSFYVRNTQIKTLYDDADDDTPNTPICLKQTLDPASGNNLTMLMDARGKVHASCGILPTKAISIPPEKFQTSLESIEVTFAGGPIIGDNERLNISLPDEPGFTWSWLSKQGNTWSETSELGEFETEDVLGEAEKIHDGWLKLTQKES